MRRLFLLTCIVLLCAGSALASDSPEARLEAAKKYAATFDFNQMMGETINQITLSIPAEHRSGFVKEMNETIDFDHLESATIAIMARVFTAEELTVLADFYGTATGQSILKKMPQMMTALMPLMQQQIAEAIERLRARGAQKPSKQPF